MIRVTDFIKALDWADCAMPNKLFISLMNSWTKNSEIVVKSEKFRKRIFWKQFTVFVENDFFLFWAQSNLKAWFRVLLAGKQKVRAKKVTGFIPKSIFIVSDFSVNGCPMVFIPLWARKLENNKFQKNFKAPRNFSFFRVGTGARLAS